MGKTKNISVDFDGVVHEYTTTFTDYLIIPDPPIVGAFSFLMSLQEQGYNVIIQTARAIDDLAVQAIRDWFLEWGYSPKLLSEIEITKEKPYAFMYIDDRAFHFNGKWPTDSTIKQWEESVR